MKDLNEVNVDLSTTKIDLNLINASLYSIDELNAGIDNFTEARKIKNAFKRESEKTNRELRKKVKSEYVMKHITLKGETVEVEYKTTTVSGTVVKLNPKTFTIETKDIPGKETLWRYYDKVVLSEDQKAEVEALFEVALKEAIEAETKTEIDDDVATIAD